MNFGNTLEENRKQLQDLLDSKVLEWEAKQRDAKGFLSVCAVFFVGLITLIYIFTGGALIVLHNPSSVQGKGMVVVLFSLSVVFSPFLISKVLLPFLELSGRKLPGFSSLNKAATEANHDYERDAIDAIDKIEGKEGFLWKFSRVLSIESLPAKAVLTMIRSKEGKEISTGDYLSCGTEILDALERKEGSMNLTPNWISMSQEAAATSTANIAKG